MTTEQKIDTFVQGIQCSTAQSIVVSMSGDLHIRTSFDAYYNAIASRIELANSLTQKPNFRKEDRFVNQEKTKNKRFREKQNKVDQNQKSKRFDRKNNTQNQNSHEKREYTEKEWESLTRAQQQAVKKAQFQQKRPKSFFTIFTLSGSSSTKFSTTKSTTNG